MNTAKIKAYAPAARREFIKAVTNKAQMLGLSENEIVPMEVQGDVAIIGGQAFPRKIAEQRKKLEERIRRDGFSMVMRAMAYTWFNRFAAIRYMELHDYLEHGFRVLSNPGGSNVPEILEQAAHVDLPGLDRDEVVELRLAGGKDEELYRLLLLAQCAALHKAMPFLFEKIGGGTELLLPDNLLHSGSVIRNLVKAIPEEDWQNVEIIGWIYQFYISEKKNEVIGKVVKSEDIPAATQLFTPNWIVKYMVQNSLGAQWLAIYPDSRIKGEMDYYIEPAEQTDEVKAQLAAITPDTLNPEELTLMDPACGSGHVLVEAYDLFKAIYLERGYRQRDVAQLILEKNLFGLDIDERAAQLTGFALMMKGRADDRRLFERGVNLNVMALADSKGFDVDQLAKSVELSDCGLQLIYLTELKRLFEHATTFGSLIQVPEGLAAKLPAMKQLIEAARQDLFVSDAPKRLGPLVQQAEMLAAQYDAVVANPPYMGSKGMNDLVKKFTKVYFPDAKSDLFACFIERGYTLAKNAGHNAMVTMQSWMFLSSFQKMRERMLVERTIRTMAHLGARAFSSISGEVVQSTVFVLSNLSPQKFKPVFFRLVEGGEDEKRTALANGEKRFDTTAQDEFKKIPGSPLAYWVSANLMGIFADEKPISYTADARQGLSTSDNDRFLRQWMEVSINRIGFSCSSKEEALRSQKRWFPYNKGGVFRKWYGNQELVINWENDGEELREWAAHLNRVGTSMGRLVNQGYYFKPCITWSSLSGSGISLRFCEQGFLFDMKGQCLFVESLLDLEPLIKFLNSKVAAKILMMIAPTLDLNCGVIAKIPFKIIHDTTISSDVLISSAKMDWNAYERSWDFHSLPILTASSDPTSTLESSYTAWITQNRETIAEMKRLEEENNRLFIDAYGLQDELTPDVPIEQITLTVNPAYRYGGKLTEEEQWIRFRQDTMKELVSYAIGCMMGRYSLDEPGLIYAQSGNKGFDHSCYTTLPADDDGIIPVMDMNWFNDDATNRFIEFLKVTWGPDTLDENLQFIAQTLKQKKSEDPEDTIRRYFSTTFFKDHLKTYKKRPIYWLFSSGKQKAFTCLVYLHRYNESTLPRMRSAYVTPLQGKFNARLDYLRTEITQASTASAKKKLQKELETIKKKQAELTQFDEELRHYADKRITLDLDDGVKVNYGKFGTLLAEKKAICGVKKK